MNVFETNNGTDMECSQPHTQPTSLKGVGPSSHSNSLVFCQHQTGKIDDKRLESSTPLGDTGEQKKPVPQQTGAPLSLLKPGLDSMLDIGCSRISRLSTHSPPPR